MSQKNQKKETKDQTKAKKKSKQQGKQNRKSTQLQKQTMLEALEHHLGVVTDAAKEADINRVTHYRWMENDPDYAQKVTEIEEVAKDFAERKIYEAISKRDPQILKMYATTKMKDRGYQQKQEIDLNGKGFHITFGGKEHPFGQDDEEETDE